MEVEKISKNELVAQLTSNGFIQDTSNPDKFIKSETVNTGKAIINGREILKTEDIMIEIEYIGECYIDDEKKDESLKGHQLKLSVNGIELEFLICDKYDLHDFFGLDVGPVPERVNRNSKVKYVEDIPC